jgi:polyhydroxyalkanoate synthesis regulator phasin
MTPGIVERFEHQQKRIDDGVKKGSLTTEEAALVQDNLNRIKADEAKLKADGKLTPKEKESLNHKLDLNGQMIKKEKKNAIKHID